MKTAFGNKDNSDAELRKASTIAIKNWVKEKLSLSDEVTIMVTEVACTEEGCADKENVIGIMQQGANQKFSIRKPLLDVRQPDVEVALKQNS